MRIKCPFCGERDHAEFQYGGDASKKMPALDADAQAWHDFVYLRDNPKGAHVEFWQHVFGCRHWLKVERDTLTHEITSVKLAKDE